MTNLLNNTTLYQTTTKKPEVLVPKQSNFVKTQTHVTNTANPIKPLEHKGKLLPSRIFDSPATIAKDFAHDVVSIGKAFKGKANDHELGRINDLALKFGSLGIATYLCIKNPLKLSKTMEFVGCGTFLAAMSLWPKLFIQAPLKMRTGVDIHQKYVDSQDRKKMLFQDPQYDLTDMFSRKDLDRMGKKLGVSKNLSDRDSYIKQRAKKTAIQGNTLWMMTAGFATPLASALMCNRLEKPINNLYEKIDLAKTEFTQESAGSGIQGKLKDSAKKIIKDINKKTVENANKKTANSVAKNLEKFINENKNNPVNSGMIDKLTQILTSSDINSDIALRDAIKADINVLAKKSCLTDEAVRKVLTDVGIGNDVTDNILKNETLQNEIRNGAVGNVANILTKSIKKGCKNKKEINEFNKLLKSELSKQNKPSLNAIAYNLTALGEKLNKLAGDKGSIDKYIEARVGDKSGVFAANQFENASNTLIKAMTKSQNPKLLNRLLNGSNKELQQLMNGNTDDIASALNTLVKDETQYNKLVTELLNIIEKTENTIGAGFSGTVDTKAKELLGGHKNNFMSYTNIQNVLNNEVKYGTAISEITTNAKAKATGVTSSFYRLLQTLDFFKREANGSLISDVRQHCKCSDDDAKKIIEAGKKYLLDATIVDNAERLTTSSFNLTDANYKNLMKFLYDKDSNVGNVNNTLTNSLNNYKDAFRANILNWRNDMTPGLGRRVLDGNGNTNPDFLTKNALTGKSTKSLIQENAKKYYNSQIWLRIFGGSFAALAAVTLIAGLAIGKKTKVEKQAEQESKING